MTGTLTAWRPARGFGFVALADDRSAFLPLRHLERWPDDPPPRIGDRVEFALLETL